MNSNNRQGQRSRMLNSARSHLNRIMVWPLAAVALLSSLFYGGNLPIYWVIWAVVAGMMGTLWFGWLALKGEEPRLPVNRFPLLAAGFALFALYHLVQVAPLGDLVAPVRSLALPGVTFALSTISVEPGETVFALFRWLTFGVFFFLALQVSGVSARGQKLLDLIFWGIVLHAFIGLAFRFQFGDTMFGIPKWAYLGSTTGGFVNRNSFATYLAFGAVLGVTRIMAMSLSRARSATARHVFDFYTGRHGVMPFIVGWLIIVVALITTNSRMGLLSAIAGMGFVIVILAFKRPEGSRRRTWRFPLIAMGVIFALVVFYGADLYSRVENLYLNDDLGTRLKLYEQVWQMIMERPLLGFGGSAFNAAYPLFHRLPVGFEYVWDKTHSTYLALWVEYGLLFGSLPMLIIAAIFLRLMASTFRAAQSDPLIVAAAGVILTGALHSLFDFSLEMEGVAIVYAMVIAAGFAKVLSPRTQLNEEAA